jgi:hypothetical protein
MWYKKKNFLLHDRVTWENITYSDWTLSLQKRKSFTSHFYQMHKEPWFGVKKYQWLLWIKSSKEMKTYLYNVRALSGLTQAIFSLFYRENLLSVPK